MYLGDSFLSHTIAWQTAARAPATNPSLSASEFARLCGADHNATVQHVDNCKLQYRYTEK